MGDPETAYKWLRFLSSLVFLAPQLVVCVTGLVLGARRRDLGKRAQYGIAGFALLGASLLLGCLITWFAAFLFVPGNAANFSRNAALSSTFGFISLGLQVAGFVLLLLAAFHRDRPKPAAAPPSAGA